MMPIGPLMIEHRLIEKMIAVMRNELGRIEREQKADPVFVDTAVDFIRMYADRCHHGKEEDILFRDLKKKDLAKEHLEIMQDLIDDHKRGREITGRLVEAKKAYVQGDKKSLPEIVACIEELIDFYPKHIEKEDKHFFLPVMDYFTDEEKDAMLLEGYEFDRSLIHEKYKTVVETYETR